MQNQNTMTRPDSKTIDWMVEPMTKPISRSKRWIEKKPGLSVSRRLVRS